MGGGGGGVKTESEASARFANIAREQWNWEKQMYVPRIPQLVNETMGQVPATQAVGFAKNAVSQAFDSAQGAQARDLARMGVTPTAAQATEMAASNAADRGSLLVATQNAARQHVKDRNLAVMAGGMGGAASMSNLTRGAS